MRTLKYAILGLLCGEPMTGYDILIKFEKGLGHFWRAQHSQIYRELAALAQDGDVEYKTVVQGKKLEKKLYTITEQGRIDFCQWLRRDEPLEPTPKDVFRLRTYLSDDLTKEEFSAIMHSQLVKREEKVKRERDYLKKMLGDTNPRELNRTALGDYMVLTGAIMREQAYVDWLRLCLDIIGDIK